MKTNNLICSECGKTDMKYPRGIRANKVMCQSCYRKQLNSTDRPIKKIVNTSNVEFKQSTFNQDDEFNDKFETYVNNLSDEMKLLIPENNGYIDEDKIIDELESAYKYNFVNTNDTEKFNYLFKGETGTGKTQCAVSFAHKMKIPCYVVSFDGAITPEKLIGYQKLVIKNGVQEQEWQDGILTKFVREGGVLVLDESNACPAEISFALFKVLSKLRQLDLLECNGEVINAHPGFFVIGTMNPDYEGTNEMNKALLSRFNQQRVFDYSTKVENKLVKSGKILNKEIVKLANKQRSRYKQGEFSNPISTRDLILFKTAYDVLGEQKALQSLVNKFETVEEQKAIQELYNLEVKTINSSQSTDENSDEDSNDED